MKKVLISSLILLCVGLLLFLLKPIWHPLVMVFAVESPIIIEATVVIGVLFGFVLVAANYSRVMFSFAMVLFFGSLIFFTLAFSFSYVYKEEFIAHNLINPAKISSLPASRQQRLLPKLVAKRYALSALQMPRYTIGDAGITALKGKLYWSFGLVPDGGINSLALKEKGAIFVNMGVLKKEVKVVERQLDVGEGIYITDNYLWKLINKKYFVDYQKPIYIYKGGKLFLAVPFIRYELHFKSLLLYSVPKWGGVAIINQKGKIKFLSPKEAESNPLLKGQRIFPAALAREYVDALNYKRGLLNYLFLHKGQFEIVDVSGQGNVQPFLVPTEKGLKWLLACEPYGRSYGIYKLFFVDARNGKVDLFSLPKISMLVGPVEACEYVKKNSPRVDWNLMRAIEPLPLIKKGQLFWNVRVVPKGGAGVAFLALVNASDCSVRRFTTASALEKFLETGATAFVQNIKKEKNIFPAIKILIKRQGKIEKVIPLRKGDEIIIK